MTIRIGYRIAWQMSLRRIEDLCADQRAITDIFLDEFDEAELPVNFADHIAGESFDIYDVNSKSSAYAIDLDGQLIWVPFGLVASVDANHAPLAMESNLRTADVYDSTVFDNLFEAPPPPNPYCGCIAHTTTTPL